MGVDSKYNIDKLRLLTVGYGRYGKSVFVILTTLFTHTYRNLPYAAATLTMKRQIGDPIDQNLGEVDDNDADIITPRTYRNLPHYVFIQEGMSDSSP